MLLLTGTQVVRQVLGQKKVGPGSVALMLPLWSSRRAVIPHPLMGEMPWPPKAPRAMNQDSHFTLICPTLPHSVSGSGVLLASKSGPYFAPCTQG